MNKKYLLAACLIPMAVFYVYPWRHTVAPATRVQILNEDGSPARDVLTRQDWNYFVIGADGDKEYSRTDENGYVSFPQRSARTSFAAMDISLILEVVSGGHYGMGAHADIWAQGNDPYLWSFVPCSVKDSSPRIIQLGRRSVAIPL
jgi:hypothetical protein